MHLWLLPLLACPACRTVGSLQIDGPSATDSQDSIEEGCLRCAGCAATYPVRRGIPRFLAADAGQFRNFGFQWQRWRTIQIDRLAGHDLSARRFFADSRWKREWLRGKLVLDAGCGAGRFADVAALAGARVVACDISDAVEAARENTAVHGDAVQVVQASIFELPFCEGAFDAVYCMGVIQHTPEPEAAMRALPRLLKPGGRLVYNFYEAGWRARTQIVKYALRFVTRYLSADAILVLSRALVAAFFPLSRALGAIPVVRQINHYLPIAAVHAAALTVSQQREWTLLDTFDWYSARYEKRQDHRRVMALLRESGLVEVEGQPGLAWARRPDGPVS